MRQFDLHEFLGYIAPGMLLLVGGWYFSPAAQKAFPAGTISFGEFGVGVVLAYVAGHFLQAAGNAISYGYWWFWAGQPTDWLRTGKHRLVYAAQATQVERKVRKMLQSDSIAISGLSRGEWRSVLRQIRVAVAGAGRSHFIEVFSANYGLCRGTGVCLLIMLALNIAADWKAWGTHVVLAVLFGIAMYRMHRFGVYYARQVFVEFIEVSNNPDAGDKK